MTNRLALIVAIVLGVLSILLIRFYLEKMKVQYDTASQLVDLYVAARDLHAGDVVSEKDIQTRKFPHAILDGLGKYMEDQKEIEGSKVVVPEIKQGQVFNKFHFNRVQTRAPLNLKDGYRAVTIPLTVVNGISGMLKPTDDVDVVVTSDFKVSTSFGPAGKGIKVTRTLLKKVQILALDDKTDRENQFSDYTTATLALTPEDANRFYACIDGGSVFHLIKINDREESPAGENPVWDNKLFHEVDTDILKTEEQWRRR